MLEKSALTIPRQIERISCIQDPKQALLRATGNIITGESIFVAGHLHTEFSGKMSNMHPFTQSLGLNYFDSTEPVARWLHHAADTGLDAVIFTDHDNQEAAQWSRDLITSQDLPVVSVPGIELSLGPGHTLVLNHMFQNQDEIDYVRRRFQNNTWDDAEFQSFCDEIRGKGGYIIPAHPFDQPLPSERNRNLWQTLYGFEAYNNTVLSNAPLERLPNKIKDMELDIDKALLLFSGSDAHSVKRSTSFTEIHAPRAGNIDYKDQDKSSARIMELLAGGLADGTITEGMRTNLTFHNPKSPALLRKWLVAKDIIITQFRENQGASALRLVLPALTFAVSSGFRDMIMESYKNI